MFILLFEKIARPPLRTELLTAKEKNQNLKSCAKSSMLFIGS
jgi:hypothetical protein